METIAISKYLSSITAFCYLKLLHIFAMMRQRECKKPDMAIKLYFRRNLRGWMELLMNKKLYSTFNDNKFHYFPCPALSLPSIVWRWCGGRFAVWFAWMGSNATAKKLQFIYKSHSDRTPIHPPPTSPSNSQNKFIHIMLFEQKKAQLNGN